MKDLIKVFCFDTKQIRMNVCLCYLCMCVCVWMNTVSIRVPVPIHTHINSSIVRPQMWAWAKIVCSSFDFTGSKKLFSFFTPLIFWKISFSSDPVLTSQIYMYFLLLEQFCRSDLANGKLLWEVSVKNVQHFLFQLSKWEKEIVPISDT